jgi:hypothetical protein
MTRVGNVDQVLLLLREQLQRTAKGRGAAKNASSGRAGAAGKRPLDRVRALAAFDSRDEDEVRRAVVRGVLTEEFGEAVGNDAALQTIVDDVVRMIRETPGGPELIDRAVAQLKASKS